MRKTLNYNDIILTGRRIEFTRLRRNNQERGIKTFLKKNKQQEITL